MMYRELKLKKTNILICRLERECHLILTNNKKKISLTKKLT